MQCNRPPAIVLPERLPDLPARAFARGTGQDFAATATTIELYDEIGVFGVSAKDVRAALQNAPGDITVRVNSPGGCVFNGLAIFNDLTAHQGNVRIEVTGIAASIASIILMAGDERAIAENGFVMIHNSRALTGGDARTHEELSGVLRRIDSSMAQTYASRSGNDVAAIRKMMDNESWFTASEAKAAGLVTDIASGAGSQRAKFDLSVYAKAPPELRAAFEVIDPTNPRDLERALREAGVSRARAKAIVSSGYRQLEQRDADSDYLALAAYISTRAEQLKSI